jgi:hypothetical protein
MKVAICIHGQPRLYKNGFDNINEFCELNKNCMFDFFFHTWYSSDLVGSYYECSTWRNINKYDLLITENTIDDLIELYKPKKFLYEKPKLFEIDNLKNTLMYKLSEITKPSTLYYNNLHSVISNIYSKYKVSELLNEYVKDNQVNYDIVISIRFDFLNKININLLNDIKLDKLNSMKNCDNRLYISDHLVISNYDIFTKYSSTYINIDKIVNNKELIDYLNYVNCGHNICPETLMTANMYLYYKDLYDIVYYNSKIINYI